MVIFVRVIISRVLLKPLPLSEDRITMRAVLGRTLDLRPGFVDRVINFVADDSSPKGLESFGFLKISQSILKTR